MNDIDIHEFTTGSEWESWLETYRVDGTKAWLRIRRARADLELVAIGDALDGALCFGWIDGQRLSFDDQSFLQRYSPRHPRSPWSRINVEKVERLVAGGRIRPSGIAQIEAAKADGRWGVAYERQSMAEAPADLENVSRVPQSTRKVYQDRKSERYAAMLSLLKARTPEERERGLARVANLLEPGN